jgi:hypothetical protein
MICIQNEFKKSVKIYVEIEFEIKTLLSNIWEQTIVYLFSLAIVFTRFDSSIKILFWFDFSDSCSANIVENAFAFDCYTFATEIKLQYISTQLKL